MRSTEPLRIAKRQSAPIPRIAFGLGSTLVGALFACGGGGLPSSTTPVSPSVIPVSRQMIDISNTGEPAIPAPHSCLVSTMQSICYSAPYGLINANGRFVVFQSDAGNLVSGGINGSEGIFLRDTCVGEALGCTPTTTRIWAGTNSAEFPTILGISDDGGVILFRVSTDTVSTDTFALFLQFSCAGRSNCNPQTDQIDADLNAAGTIPFNVALTHDGRYVYLGIQGGVVYLKSTCYQDASCVPTTSSPIAVVNPNPPGGCGAGTCGVIDQIAPSADGSSFVALSNGGAWWQGLCGQPLTPCSAPALLNGTSHAWSITLSPDGNVAAYIDYPSGLWVTCTPLQSCAVPFQLAKTNWTANVPSIPTDDSVVLYETANTAAVSSICGLKGACDAAPVVVATKADGSSADASDSALSANGQTVLFVSDSGNVVAGVNDQRSHLYILPAR
jgi:hypothetical protein